MLHSHTSLKMDVIMKIMKYGKLTQLKMFHQGGAAIFYMSSQVRSQDFIWGVADERL